MKKSLYLLLSLCVLFSTCKKDDDVPSRTVFKFTLPYGNPAEDYWIVLHDNLNGEFIDAKQITPDASKTIVFESTRPIANAKMDVTSFRGSNKPTGGGVANIFMGIDVGTAWVNTPGRSYNYPNPGSTEGTYTLKVTGVPAVTSFTISDSFGRAEHGNQFTFAAETVTEKASINANDHSHFVSIDTGTGNPKYTMIEVSANKTFTIAYSTFKDFDKYVTMSFPKTTSIRGTVVGYKSDAPINWSSYSICDYPPTGSPVPERTELKIGLLNSLPNYSMELNVSAFHYLSYGPAPASIQYVAGSSFTVSQTSIDDYTITSSTDFLHRSANFGYDDNNSVDFYYHGPRNGASPHHEAINSEIASQYKVDLSKVAYKNTTFYVQGLSYPEWIRSYFDPSFDQDSFYDEASLYILK